MPPCLRHGFTPFALFRCFDLPPLRLTCSPLCDSVGARAHDAAASARALCPPMLCRQFYDGLRHFSSPLRLQPLLIFCRQMLRCCFTPALRHDDTLFSCARYVTFDAAILLKMIFSPFRCHARAADARHMLMSSRHANCRYFYYDADDAACRHAYITPC